MPYSDGTPAPNDQYRIAAGLEPLIFDKATGQQVNPDQTLYQNPLYNRNGIYQGPKINGGLAGDTYLRQGGEAVAAQAAATRQPGYGTPPPEIMNQTPNPTNVSEIPPGSVLKTAPPPAPSLPPQGGGMESMPGPMVNSTAQPRVNPQVNATAAPSTPAAPKRTGATNFRNAFTRARAKREVMKAPNASQY